MEFCAGGTLHDFIVNCQQSDMRLSRHDALSLAVQLLRAVACVHSKGLVHRDITPRNIYFGGPDASVLKLGDFGVSTVAGPGGNASIVNKWSPSVPSFVAEAKETPVYNQQRDIFATAITLFRAFTMNAAIFSADRAVPLDQFELRMLTQEVRAHFGSDIAVLLEQVLAALYSLVVLTQCRWSVPSQYQL